MSEPLIVCICLAHIRPDFVLRSHRCFESQLYPNKFFSVMDTVGSGATIGAMRNELIADNFPCEYIAHWDYDDVSAPDRLSCQLAHVKKTGKLVTGFFDMPLYDAKKDKVWIYTNSDHRYALGTSLFYKREAWERVKFPDKTPEDNRWRREVGYDNCESQSVFREDGTPMMVQVIHGGNASARIVPSDRLKYKEASEAQDKAVRDLLASA